MQRRENAQDGTIIDIIVVGMRVAMTTMRVFDIIFYNLVQVVVAMAIAIVWCVLMTIDRRVATTWRETSRAKSKDVSPRSNTTHHENLNIHINRSKPKSPH